MAVTDVSLADLQAAFDLVLAQWPAEIVPGAKTFHLGGGCNMRALNEAHVGVERWSTSVELSGITDEIFGSVEHYVFTTIHDALQNLKVLRTTDLDFESFCSRFDGDPNFRIIRS